MGLHELRTYRVAPGASVDELIQFFRRDGQTDYRVALREAEIAFAGAWRTAGRADELVWIRAFRSAAEKEAACARLYGGRLWNGGLKEHAVRLVGEVETIDLEVQDARELAAGVTDGAHHELRHYRLAPGALPAMLAFFEDVRRFLAPFEVRVLAWWTARVDGSDRFLWLREFESAEAKERLSYAIYGSAIWLSEMKPRTVGVIEERILKDLIPVPAAAIGAADPLP